MLEIACVAGLLMFGHEDRPPTYYNPDQISHMRIHKDDIVVGYGGDGRTYWNTDAETKKETNEAFEYALEAWRECKLWGKK